MSSLLFRQVPRTARVARTPTFALSKGARTIMTPTHVAYTASATASGGGRDGKTKINNDAVSPLNIEIPLALPKSMGGNGKGSNPEQLFSAGYSACYLSALHACARKVGKKLENPTVEVLTNIGPTEASNPGFALIVELKVGGVNDQSIVDAAHNMCPYSRALKHGVKTSTTLV